MQAEHLEILDFLRRHQPFAELTEETLNQVATHIEVSYFKAGSQIHEFGQEVDAWCVIRSGSVEVYRRNGDLYNRLSEGGFFGEFGLLRHKPTRFPSVALEDTLIYLVPEPVFTQLFEENEAFADYVEIEDRTRLRQTIARKEDSNELMTAKVNVLINREPVALDSSTTVQQAARRMSDEGVSSLLILHPAQSSLQPDKEDEPGHPVMAGLITDRDIRNRVVGQGLDYNTPVSEIMTTDLIHIQHNQLVFEAMLAMLKHNIHHLPVLRKRQPIGIIALSDIIRYESQNSLFVVSSIFRATRIDELKTLSSDVRSCFTRMVTEDANSRMIGSAMSVIGRSFKQRLLELAEEALGPPPVPYCFLALGSMARDEQLIVTDQDNAMVLDNRFDPALHDAYFLKLAQFVSDGLDACGYKHCKGEIMATNPQWRQPLHVWEDYFSEWIDKPTPQTLLNSFIFFDLEAVWGKTEWADRLIRLIANKAQHNSVFLACMARNALLRTPPLGFFKNFVMEHSGQQTRSIDMKRRGTAPLADLIRVHALAIGSHSRNSFERLTDVIESGILPPGRGQDLRDALEFISMVRIRHQALDLEAGREPDNKIEPENLSDFERKNLKDAFQILSNAQKFLKYRYQAGRST